MITTLEEPKVRSNRRSTVRQKEYNPIISADRKKSLTKSTLLSGLVVCGLACVILLSLSNNRLFLTELVVSSLIIMMLLILKQTQPQLG